MRAILILLALASPAIAQSFQKQMERYSLQDWQMAQARENAKREARYKQLLEASENDVERQAVVESFYPAVTLSTKTSERRQQLAGLTADQRKKALADEAKAKARKRELDRLPKDEREKAIADDLKAATERAEAFKRVEARVRPE